MTQTQPYPLMQARSRLGELVSRARFGRERVVITEDGEPVAVLISVDELAELQQTQDAADLALCQRIKIDSGPGVPHDAFMAMLEAEDARSR